MNIPPAPAKLYLMKGGALATHRPTYWLRLKDFSRYQVDQDRYLMIRERAGLPRVNEDFTGVITATQQPIQGWVMTNGQGPQ